MRFSRRTLALTVAALGAAWFLFVIFFDRYRYFDYEEALCDAGPVMLAANLVGTFGSAKLKERSSPYYLRIEVIGKSIHDAALDGIRLTSSKRTVRVDRIRRFELGEQDGAPPKIVYLANSLSLDHDDYSLSGVVVANAGSNQEFPFQCLLKRRYDSEWRIPLMDALMSA